MTGAVVNGFGNTWYKVSFNGKTGYIVSDKLAFVSPPAASYKFSPWSNDSYTYIGETDAGIGQQIDVYSGTCTAVGMYLYDQNGTYLAEARDNSYYYLKFFKINEECHYTLSPGTTYKYKFYAIINGNTYWGEENSFTTKPSSTPSSSNFSFTTNEYHSIGDDEVILGKRLTVIGISLSSVSEVGIDIFNSYDTWIGGKSEPLGVSQNYINTHDYIDIWYYLKNELGMTLMDNTTYKLMEHLAILIWNPLHTDRHRNP